MNADDTDSPFLHVYDTDEDDMMATFFDNGEAYGFGGNDLSLFINVSCEQDIFIRGCK